MDSGGRPRQRAMGSNEGGRLMSGYTPLFQSIVTSSIWNESDTTRIVWISLLALADSDGKVEGSAAGLAPVARVKIEQCEKALEKLKAPDPYSRTKEHEGRRIIEIDGGWQILNHGKFRQRAKSRAEYMRHYRQKKKVTKEEKIKDSNPNPNTNIETHRNTPLQGVTVTHSFSLQDVKNACIANGIPEKHAQSYFDQYNSQGWLKGNKQQITNLQSHMRKRWNDAKQCWDFDVSRTNQTESVADQVQKFKEKGDL
ncbi:MAG: hypothetical protein ACFFCW_00600 [Candidatus Hodarchaeota archaeon]